MIAAPIGHNQLRPASTMRVNSGRLSNAITPKFGSSCLSCTGAVGGPAIALNVAGPGTGDFTFEMWVYINSTITQLTSFIEQPKAGGSLGTNASGRLVFAQSYTSTAFTDSVALPLTTWTSIAACRQGTNLYVFKNGTLLSTVTGYNTDLTQNTYIGSYIGSSVSNGGFNGYMDELRVSNVCRYTSSYTPATTPFVDDANTLVLCHFDNLAISNVSITDDNT